jgi:hypothetical protein
MGIFDTYKNDDNALKKSINRFSNLYELSTKLIDKDKFICYPSSKELAGFLSLVDDLNNTLL